MAARARQLGDRPLEGDPLSAARADGVACTPGEREADGVAGAPHHGPARGTHGDDLNRGARDEDRAAVHSQDRLFGSESENFVPRAPPELVVRIAAHTGPGRCILGDARVLPLGSRSRDVAIVQGGLHHLATFDDVALALAEMRRVVVPDGRVVIIEPWQTPFLRAVHALSEQRLLRRLIPKVDAFATMTEEESETYFRWLNAPGELLELIRRHISPAILRRRWGKLTVVGTPLA